MENKEYLDFISLKEAVIISGYAQDYLRYLIRNKKLKGVKIGRNWLTKKVWVLEFLNHNNLPSSEIEEIPSPLSDKSQYKEEIARIKRELESMKKLYRVFAALFIFLLFTGLLFARQDIPSRVGAQLNNSFSVLKQAPQTIKTLALEIPLLQRGKQISIPPLLKGGVGGFFSKELSSLKSGFHSMGNFISQTLGQVPMSATSRIFDRVGIQVSKTLQQAQGIVAKPFASVFDWLFRPITKEAPPSVLIVREIIRQEEEIPASAGMTDKEKEGTANKEAASPARQPGITIQKEIIQPKQIIEITKETRVVETIKETIREITRAADLIPIENMLNSLSSKVSSVIDASGYVSSPRQYQQQGDLYLTTTGSGNVYVSASQGTYLSGQQLILDATASGNQGIATILLKDPTTIQGTLSSQNGIDITGSNLTVGGTKFTVSPDTGNITSAGLLSLTQTTGTSTISHNFQVQGLLRVGTGTTYITADYIQTPYFTSGSTSTAVTGDFSVSSNATTTGNQIIQGTLTVNATSTLATTSLTYIISQGTATSTFAGPIAASTGNLLLSRAGSGDLLLNPYGGNVGIGSTTPSQLLSIAGNGYLTGGLGVGVVESTAGNITGTGRLSITGSSATSTFAGGLTIDTDTLVIDYQTNKVGIGTSSPYAKLSVVGQTVSDFFTATSTTATSTFPYLSITNNSNLGTIIGGTWQGSTITANYGGTGITSATAGYVLIGNSATALQATSTLFVSSGGNVGIGTTSPSYKLTIQGGTGENLLQIATSTNPNILVITSSGNVGIGSTSPAQLLSVAGSGYLTGGLGVGQVETTAGNITATGRLSITSTSATSTFSTGGLTVGTSQFVVQGATGNIGIGTTSPSSPLDVIGNTEISGYVGLGSSYVGRALTVVDSSLANDTLSYMTVFGAGSDATLGSLDLQFGFYPSATGANRYVRISAGDNTGQRSLALNPAGGSVGIGTASPVTFLDIRGPRPVDQGETGNYNIAYGHLNLESTDAYTTQYGGSIAFRGIRGSGGGKSSYAIIRAKKNNATNDWAGGQLEFMTTQEGTGVTGVKMVITHDGNVGIGTTSPISPLHVYKSTTAGAVIYIENPSSGTAAYTSLQLDTTGSVGALYKIGTGYTTSNQYVAGSLLFETGHSAGIGINANNAAGSIRSYINGAEKMRVDSAGNVGIGTTTPTSELHIRGENAGLTIEDSVPGVGAADRFKIANQDGTFRLLNVYASSRTDFVVDGSGNFTIATLGTGANYYVCASSAGLLSESSGACSGSSIQYKTNVADLSLGLETLKQLRPVTFNWRDDYRPEEPGLQLGFIAEEVEQLNPMFVSYKDGQIHGVKYDQMVALLTKSIQELNTKVDGLAASILTWLEDKMVRVKELVAEKITGKEAQIEKARMKKIEMEDQATGEIYCTWISDGEWIKVKGECP